MQDSDFFGEVEKTANFRGKEKKKKKRPVSEALHPTAPFLRPPTVIVR